MKNINLGSVTTGKPSSSSSRKFYSDVSGKGKIIRPFAGFLPAVEDWSTLQFTVALNILSKLNV
jgi:hypothetical protein